MTFNAQIPQAGDSISASQPPILTNFTQLDALFGIDHVQYTNATQAARGRHTKITFNDLSADPGLAKPISSLYTKGPAGGPMNLFFQNDTLVTNIVQITGNILIDSGNDGFGGAYQVFQTPWGLKIWTGQLQSFSGSRNFTMSGALSFGGAIYTAQLTPYGSGPLACSLSPNAGLKTFNAQMQAGGAPGRWLIITS